MASFDVLAEGLGHPEGPAALPDGRIVFVESFRGRVSAWDSDGGIQLFADVGGVPCACAVGTDGVYLTQAGHALGGWQAPHPTPPSIQKIMVDGALITVALAANEVPLLAPNDLVFGGDGLLYFTDPGPFAPDSPTDGRVCAIDPSGRCFVLVEVGPAYPNGITVEADGSVVWTESYTRQVRRRRPDGTVELVTILAETHVPDGLKVGDDGNLYITTVTSGGIDVIAPDGAPVRFIQAGVEPLNCVFQGRDLVVTDFGDSEGAALADAPACGRLLRVPAGTQGRRPHRSEIPASHKASEQA